MPDAPRPPRIVATLLVHNERETLQANIAHHWGQGIFEFVVTDNASTDGTAEIAERCPGVVDVIRQPGATHEQGEWVTRMARHPACLAADWVIHLDADEFWFNLAPTLAHVPPEVGVVRVLEIHDHVPYPRTSPHRHYGPANFREHIPRYATRRHYGRIAHRPSADAVVAAGNHEVCGIPGSLLTLPPGYVGIHHYPIRSYDQFEAKVRRCAQVVQHLHSTHATHWREQVRALEEGRLHELYDRYTERGYFYASV